MNPFWVVASCSLIEEFTDVSGLLGAAITKAIATTQKTNMN